MEHSSKHQREFPEIGLKSRQVVSTSPLQEAVFPYGIRFLHMSRSVASSGRQRPLHWLRGAPNRACGGDFPNIGLKACFCKAHMTGFEQTERHRSAWMRSWGSRAIGARSIIDAPRSEVAVSQDGIELVRRMGDFEPVDRQRDLPLDVDSENGMRELLDALPAGVYIPMLPGASHSIMKSPLPCGAAVQS
jgi:hypothetical protein